jgi:hypothetical protein
MVMIGNDFLRKIFLSSKRAEYNLSTNCLEEPMYKN